MTRPLRVGLTGGIGSGKSLAAACFARLGVTIIDTDAIAHALTGPAGSALPEIEAVFGEGVLSPEGCLDRPRLRERIFADPRARRQLEAILHPRILSDVRARLIAEHGIYVILVVPLLVETPEFLALVDRVLVVDCPEALQIERALSRPGMSRALLDAILAAQSTRAQRLALADDVLDNGGGISALEEAVASLHAHYLAQAVAQGFTLPAQSLHFSMWRES